MSQTLGNASLSAAICLNLAHQNLLGLENCTFGPHESIFELTQRAGESPLQERSFDFQVHMPITSCLFEAFLKCPTKCYLLSLGERATGNEYADWVRMQNESYRSDGIKRLTRGITLEDCASSLIPTENVISAKWNLAISYVARALDLESAIHAVEKVTSEARDKPEQFIPIRFIFKNKLSRDDKLLLAFDALALSETLKQEVGNGKIIHGHDRSTLKVKIGVLASEVQKLTKQLRQILTLTPQLADCPSSDRNPLPLGDQGGAIPESAAEYLIRTLASDI